MTIPTATKNNILNGQDIDAVSLHTAFPGTTGANEVTGGSYARQAATLNTSSGGSRILTAGVSFSVPACTVSWIGTLKSGVFVDAYPNGGATPKNFMAVPATGLIQATGHGWSDTQKIAFFGGPPAPLVEGQTYFVRDSAADTFKPAATSGGVAVAMTTASSAGCWVVAITEDVYASPGTHTVSAGTVTVPD